MLEFEKIFLQKTKEWKAQINLDWASFLESKILQFTFSPMPQIYDFYKKVTWLEGTYEFLEDTEIATISFTYPGFIDDLFIFMEVYPNDYSIYLHIDGQDTDFRTLLGGANSEKEIWRTFWEFDLFSYITNYQKIMDCFKHQKILHSFVNTDFEKE